MKKLYRFKTRVGYFYIVKNGNDYCSVFDDEILDTQPTIQRAIEEIAGGHTWSNRSGVDSSLLDISDDLSDWERLFR